MTIQLILATALPIHPSVKDMNLKTTVYATASAGYQGDAEEPTSPQVAGTSDVARTELSEETPDSTGVSLRLVAVLFGSVIAAVLFIAALYFAMTRLLRK